MRRLLMTMTLVALLAPWTCWAQGGTGLGIIVGEPTGLSLKSWVGGNSALDLGLAWSFSHDGNMHVHGDYLAHNFNLFDLDSGALPLYYGIGARVLFTENDARVGLRVPVGLAYIFSGSRADLFVELAPLLDLTPDTEFNLNGAAGLRYFFQ
jgi:hypothetical protein